MDSIKPEDPRAKSNRYSKGARAKFDKDQFDFAFTQFLIDDNYVGDPPNVQVSIDNLNDNIDENFLKKDLTKLGKIRTLEIIRNPRTGQHLGLAKVQFEEVSVAQACVDSFHGKHLMGRQLNVFKDLRFTIIEKLKEAKLNPRPPTLPVVAVGQQTIIPIQQSTTATQILVTAPNSSIQQTNSSLHPHLTNPHLPILPPPPHHSHHSTPITAHSSVPPHLQKQTNSIGSIPSPLSLEYPITPASISSSTTAISSESSSRQRLEDRIAILMKQPNCMLSTIVAPAAPQVSPTYSAFNLNNESNYDYANSSYYHQQSNVPLKSLDKQRADLNDFRRSTSNNHHSNHHSNNKELSYHNKYDKYNNKSERYSEQNSDDDWNKLPEKVKPQPLNIELTIKQIETEVLPFCYKQFHIVLEENLIATTFKKLRENYGYQCIEKAQAAYKAKQDQAKIKQDKERIDKELQKQFERRYMSKSRVEKPTEAPRPRVNLIRQRTSDYSLMQDSKRRGDADLRRVNRSSAYVAEPERRGSHNTSVDSDFSDSESSSSSSSATSSSSSSLSSSSGSLSSSSSRSSSRSSSLSRSESPYSSSNDSDYSFDRAKVSKNELNFKIESKSDTSRRGISSRSESREETNELTTNSGTKGADELLAVSALLSIGGKTCSTKEASDNNSAKSNLQDDEMDVVKRTTKSAGRKRKKKSTETIVVASEYRAAKRFASDPTGALATLDENIENAMIDDENYLEPEAKFMYPERSEAEKKRMLDDLAGTLMEEDIKYLEQVHLNEGYNKNQEVQIPFGSDSANRAHLNMRKHMIEGKAAEGHPKWWRGCSRCDAIEKDSEKEENIDEMNYEDLTKAPIKSHVILAAGNSSRRDQRGDQRRIAVLNANLDPEVIKMYTTSTLQMRAKNLRFSRSKIHKWGLFACEKIAKDEAVIEYVGEKIRPSLADHREANMLTHKGSSYFFRVDYDVIDATLKGNKARFINHSCNPNCIAKVIKHDNGSNSIVIYAKQIIQADEEITYDYKFPREETDQKIRCNCKAPNCQKYLN